MVLELARPSEAWCFAPGGDFFEAVLPQATKSLEKCCYFLGFQTTRQGVFWRGFGTRLACPSAALCFPPGR